MDFFLPSSDFILSGGEMPAKFYSSFVQDGNMTNPFFASGNLIKDYVDSAYGSSCSVDGSDSGTGSPPMSPTSPVPITYWIWTMGCPSLGCPSYEPVIAFYTPELAPRPIREYPTAQQPQLILTEPKPPAPAQKLAEGAARVANDRTTPVRRMRLIKWSLPPPTTPAVPLPGWRSMPYELDVYWLSAFAWFFRPFYVGDGHVWTLQPIDVPPESETWCWHAATYTAKVRFQCKEGHSKPHGWTSMKGRVVFWFRMRRSEDPSNPIVTEVKFQLFGQACGKCTQVKDFVVPLWYHEEIENAVGYLAAEVKQKYYGGEKFLPPRRLRGGNPSSHHNPSKCQACQQGLCLVLM